jgi:hypothetical protein
VLPEGNYHHLQSSTLVCSHMVTSPNATAAKIYIGVRVSLRISQHQFLELSSKNFDVSLEKSYQHDGGGKQGRKNEALNNVIIIHQNGGSEPDNRNKARHYTHGREGIDAEQAPWNPGAKHIKYILHFSMYVTKDVIKKPLIIKGFNINILQNILAERQGFEPWKGY